MGGKRDIAILATVEAGLIIAACLVPRAAAKPAALIASVKGVVLDQQTEFPIPYPEVTIDELPLEIGNCGRFTINGLPLGTYIIKATAPGYRPAELTWNITETSAYVFEIELVPIETLW